MPLLCRYVEFYDVMSVPMAIALSGQPIMVKPYEAEKNLVQFTATAAAGAGGLIGSGAARRYLSHLGRLSWCSYLVMTLASVKVLPFVQLQIQSGTSCMIFNANKDDADAKFNESPEHEDVSLGLDILDVIFIFPN